MSDLMREGIGIYRARNDIGQLFVGALVPFDGKVFIQPENDESEMIPVEEKTVSEFAGKRDRNGRRIFEHDLMRYWDGGYSEVYMVVWWRENACFAARSLGYDGAIVEALSDHFVENAMVIGQEYDPVPEKRAKKDVAAGMGNPTTTHGHVTNKIIPQESEIGNREFSETTPISTAEKQSRIANQIRALVQLSERLDEINRERVRAILDGVLNCLEEGG